MGKYQSRKDKIHKAYGFDTERSENYVSGLVVSPHGYVRFGGCYGLGQHMSYVSFVHRGVMHERTWKKKLTIRGLIRAGAKLARDVVEGE